MAAESSMVTMGARGVGGVLGVGVGAADTVALGAVFTGSLSSHA